MTSVAQKKPWNKNINGKSRLSKFPTDVEHIEKNY